MLQNDVVDNTEANYDFIGKSYEIAFAENPQQVASVHWLVQQLLGVNGTIKGHPCKIVDIGCGTGKPVCQLLANAGHDVLGVDISQAMVDAGKKNAPNAKFEKIDMLSFLKREPSEKYDAATMYLSGMAGLSQEDYRSTFASVSRILKPSGLFVLVTLPIDADRLPLTWMGRQWTTSSLSAEDALASVKKAGFDILKDETVTFWPKGKDAALCEQEDVKEETHLYVYARKVLSDNFHQNALSAGKKKSTFSYL